MRGRRGGGASTPEASAWASGGWEPPRTGPQSFLLCGGRGGGGPFPVFKGTLMLMVENRAGN